MEPINRRATQNDMLPAQEYNSTRYMCARNNALLKALRACVIDVKANAQIPSEERAPDQAEHTPKAWPQQARVAQWLAETCISVSTAISNKELDASSAIG
jgi:hypothetical protein